MPENAMSMDALVLLNSSSSEYRAGREYILPYLDHLGVPRRELDLAYTPLPANVGKYALIIVAHGAFDPTGARLGRAGRRALLAAVGSGTGLVTFDSVLPAPGELGETAGLTGVEGRVHLAEWIASSGAGASHYITAQRDGLDIAPLVDALPVPELLAPEEAVPQLEQALAYQPIVEDEDEDTDDSWQLRIEAARALGAIGACEAIVAARRIGNTSEADVRVRTAIVYALGDALANGDSDGFAVGFPVLIEAARDELGDVRVAAIDVLRRIAPPADRESTVEQILEEAQRDPHYWVRQAAVSGS